MAVHQILLVVATATLALGQRPFFAGSRPIGYPDIALPSSEGGLGNRFGDGDNSTAPTWTERLPAEANGDRALVERLSKLPLDQQPFWLINWRALEANRRNPQTYPIRPSQFAGGNTNFPPANNVGSVNTNSNSGNVNPNPANVNVNTVASKDAGSLGDRFSDDNSSGGNENLSSNNKVYGSTTSDGAQSEKLRKPVENTREVVPGINRSGNPLADTLFNSEPKPAENTREVVPGINRSGNPLALTLFNSGPNGRLESDNVNTNAEGSKLGYSNSNNKESVNAGIENSKSEKDNKESENKNPGIPYESQKPNPIKDTLFNNEPNRRPQSQSNKKSNSEGTGLHQLHSSGPGFRYSHDYDNFYTPKYVSSGQEPKDFHYDYYI